MGHGSHGFGLESALGSPLLPNSGYSRSGIDEYSVHVKEQRAAVDFQHRLDDKRQANNAERRIPRKPLGFLYGGVVKQMDTKAESRAKAGRQFLLSIGFLIIVGGVLLFIYCGLSELGSCERHEGIAGGPGFYKAR